MSVTRHLRIILYLESRKVLQCKHILSVAYFLAAVFNIIIPLRQLSLTLRPRQYSPDHVTPHTLFMGTGFQGS